MHKTSVCFLFDTLWNNTLVELEQKQHERGLTKEKKTMDEFYCQLHKIKRTEKTN